MPKKLEDCVRDVQKQGKDKSSAYAICSKSTGWKKAGKHKWRKDNKVVITEATLKKIENLMN